MWVLSIHIADNYHSDDDGFNSYGGVSAMVKIISTVMVMVNMMEG